MKSAHFLKFAGITGLCGVIAALGCEGGSSNQTTASSDHSGGMGGGVSTGGVGGEGGAVQTGGQGGASTGGSGGMSTGGAGGAGGGNVTITPDKLLALVQSCTQVSGTQKFATDSGLASTIPVCQLNGAIWWTSDMDIDCDGGQGAICKGDPWYLPDTSATDSSGNPLDASTLPFFVIPLPSNGFDFSAHGIQLGSVAAVIYAGKVEYAIFGDEGPKGIIGEGSFALAEKLGIDSDPATGGVDNGVTFIVFTGADGVVSKNEDHQEAITVGEQRAGQLLQNN